MAKWGGNGLLLVMLALVLFFSWATWTEQPTVGRPGALALTRTILREAPASRHVAIVSGDGPDEREFAETLAPELERGGCQVVARLHGSPPEVRQELESLHAAGTRVDLIAGSRQASGWTFVHDLPARFPRWADVPFVEPPTYQWPSFLLAENLRNILSQIAVIALVAIGMTMVIATGGIDLSVGSLMALSAIVCTVLLRDWGGGTAAGPAAQLACAGAGLGACAVSGLVTGLLVTRFGLPPFIATLGMLWVARGLAFKLSRGESINQVPDSFSRLGRGADLVGIPNVVVLMIALYAAAYVLMNRSVLGRYILAVGSSPRAAVLSGVPLERTLVFVYVASAALAGLGGLVQASQLQSGDPKFGQEYELHVITAVVVGGTSLSGGQGRIFGTLLGALLISVVQVGMNLLHLDRFTQMVVLGAILLGAVLIDRLRRPRGIVGGRPG